MGRSDGIELPNVHIRGSVLYGGVSSSDPMIMVGTGSTELVLDNVGTIAIDGRLTNAVSGPEIWTIELGTGQLPGVIVLDYDGWDPNDGFAGGSIFEWLGPLPDEGDTYTAPSPTDGIRRPGPCLGDVNNDGAVDANDVAALKKGRDLLGFLEECGDGFPDGSRDCFVDDPKLTGLEGSIPWHGDLNNDGVVSCADLNILGFITRYGEFSCCVTDHAEINICRADTNYDGAVDLADLAGLLSVFGRSEDTDPNVYDPLYDLNYEDCNAGCAGAEDGNAINHIDLADLAGILAAFGQTCECVAPPPPPPGFEPMSSSSAALTQSVDPYDTSGYSGSGFEGEDEHFVFDLIIEMVDPNDDWTAAGALVTTANGATLRLASFADPNDPNNPMIPEPASASEPDKYVTFVGVPKGVNVSGRFTSPGASYAGGYSGAVAYVSTGVNIAWFDLNGDSHDGPAAVMRIVVDVSAVTGADTSGGFGSVYFSETGPADPGHIKVADFESAAAAESTGEELSVLVGAFYVTD